MANDAELSPTIAAAFEIIAAVGAAKSSYINAVEAARQGRYEDAEQLVESGNTAYLQGHEAHLNLLQKSAADDESVDMSLILVHAEDQMATAETFKVLCSELIEMHRKIDARKA